jgi:hypothetical protein
LTEPARFGIIRLTLQVTPLVGLLKAAGGSLQREQGRFETVFLEKEAGCGDFVFSFGKKENLKAGKRGEKFFSFPC